MGCLVQGVDVKNKARCRAIRASTKQPRMISKRRLGHLKTRAVGWLTARHSGTDCPLWRGGGGTCDYGRLGDGHPIFICTSRSAQVVQVTHVAQVAPLRRGQVTLCP